MSNFLLKRDGHTVAALRILRASRIDERLEIVATGVTFNHLLSGDGYELQFESGTKLSGSFSFANFGDDVIITELRS